MPNPHSNLMVRKHCGDFLRQYHLRDAETLVAHKREWSQLGKIKRDAKREMSDLIDKLADGVDERRGAEFEAASDELSLMCQIIDRELDERTEIGNRSPRPNPMLAKIPICEGRIAPAVDNGYCDAAEDIAAYFSALKRYIQRMGATSRDRTIQRLVIGQLLPIDDQRLSKRARGKGFKRRHKLGWRLYGSINFVCNSHR